MARSPGPPASPAKRVRRHRPAAQEPAARLGRGGVTRNHVRHEPRALGCRRRPAARAASARGVRGRRRVAPGARHGPALGLWGDRALDNDLFLRYAKRDGLLGLATAAARSRRVPRTRPTGHRRRHRGRGAPRHGQARAVLLGTCPVSRLGPTNSRCGPERVIAGPAERNRLRAVLRRGRRGHRPARPPGNPSTRAMGTGEQRPVWSPPDQGPAGEVASINRTSVKRQPDAGKAHPKRPTAITGGSVDDSCCAYLRHVDDALRRRLHQLSGSSSRTRGHQMVSPRNPTAG